MKRLLALAFCFAMIQTKAQNPEMVWETFTYVDGSSVKVNRFRRDASGNMYSVGYVTGAVSGDHDIFVSKNDPDGNEVFTDIYDSGSGADQAIDVRIDNSGNIYVVGNTRNGNSLFARKYSSTGTVGYTNEYYGAIVTSTAEAADIRNSTGDLYITGRKTSAVSGQGGNMILIKYLSNGNTDWEIDFDGGSGTASDHDRGYQLQVDGAGNAFVLGVEDALQVSPTFISGGTPFLRAYNSAGGFLWAEVPGADGSDAEHSLLMETSANVAVYDWDRKQRYATSNGNYNEVVNFENTVNLSTRVHYHKLSDGGYVRIGSSNIKRYDALGNEQATVNNFDGSFYNTIMSGDEKLYTLHVPDPDDGIINRYNVTSSSIGLGWSYTHSSDNGFADFRLTANNTLTVSSGNDSLELHRICIPPAVELMQDSDFGGTAVCQGDTMFLSVDAEYASTYNWFNSGAGTNSDTIWEGLNFGSNFGVNLSVEIDAGNGCVFTEDFAQFTNYIGVEAYIVDQEGICESDPGYLYSLIDPNYYAYTWYFDGVQQTFNSLNDSISVALGNGTYTMEVLDLQTGCYSAPSPSHTVTSIMPDETATMTYSSSSYDQNAADPSPTMGGTPGGVFTEATGNVAVDPSNGTIDLSASTVGGPYTIVYTTQGACPGEATFDITITSLVGISEQELPVSIFPNPATDILNVNGDFDLITINSIDGRTISSSSTSTIDVSNLESGVYVLEVENQGQFGWTRFVKQ